ncbi:MAG: hypothetical protein Q4G39_08435 [Brachymonas sp.]|nr:hypothetical protein [Brachymonas sp.]
MKAGMRKLFQKKDESTFQKVLRGKFMIFYRIRPQQMTHPLQRIDESGARHCAPARYSPFGGADFTQGSATALDA